MAKKYTKLKQFELIQSAAIGLLGIGLIIAGVQIYHLRNDASQSANAQLSRLIVAAVDGLVQPLPMDAQTGKGYVYQEHLVLPVAPATLGGILYQYSAGSGDFPTEVHLSSRTDVMMQRGKIQAGASTAKQIIDMVPKFQACTRGVTVSLAPQKDRTLVTQKTLANGKTVYFYDEALCKNDQLLNYATQIQSY